MCPTVEPMAIGPTVEPPPQSELRDQADEELLTEGSLSGAAGARHARPLRITIHSNAPVTKRCAPATRGAGPQK